MRRPILLFCAVTVLLAASLVAVGHPSRWPSPESPPRQGEAAVRTGLPVHDHRALAKLVREPQNTWTNLAFVFGGALLASTCAGRLARNTGIVLICVGAGSFHYHASASERLRHLDVGAMYWLFLTVLPLCLTKVTVGCREVLERRSGILMVVAAGVAVGWTAIREIEVMQVAPFSLPVATVLTAASVILTLAHLAWRAESVNAALQLLGIVTMFGIAAMFQVGDRPGGWLYRPGGVIQGHAVWHVLIAITSVWSVRFLDRTRPAAGSAAPPAPP